MWQKQITLEQLQALFQQFIDAEVNLAPIAKLEPKFEEPPALDENGLLRVKGWFPTKPSQVHFDFAYLYEEPNWNLVRINVESERKRGV